MKTQEIIKSILQEDGKTNTAFAQQLGITPATLGERLKMKDKGEMSMDSFITMLRALGYSIEVVPNREKDLETGKIVKSSRKTYTIK